MNSNSMDSNSHEVPMEGLVTLRMNCHSGKDGNGKMARSSEMFRCPPLTTAEKAYLLRQAVTSSEELVEYAHTLKGPVTWHYTGKFKNIQMYRGEGPTSSSSTNSGNSSGNSGNSSGNSNSSSSGNSNSNSSGSSGNSSSSSSSSNSIEYLCGVTTMLGELSEVAAFFDQDTTEKMKERKSPDVTDCAVLYQLTSGQDMTNKSFRAFVKYVAVDFPLKGIRKRDFCYIEGQTTFRHTSGRRGWVLSMHSIQLPYFPQVDGVVRASFYHSGYVCVEAERPGYLDVMHSLQVNFKGNMRLPHFVLNYGLKRRIAGMVDVSRFIKARRAQGKHQTSYQKVELVPKHLRVFCYVCSRKFTLFNRKTRCRICGEVVCQPCAPRIQWIAGEQGHHGNPNGHGLIKLRVCHICSESAFQTHANPNGPVPKGTTTASTEDDQNDDQNDDQDDDQDDDDETRHIKELARQAAQGFGGNGGGNDTDDGDDDTLEVQTSRSVFAPERFTNISVTSSVLRNQTLTNSMHHQNMNPRHPSNKWRDSRSTTVSIPLWDSVREEENPVYEGEGMNLSYHSKASEVSSSTRSHSQQRRRHQRHPQQQQQQQLQQQQQQHQDQHRSRDRVRAKTRSRSKSHQSHSHCHSHGSTRSGTSTGIGTGTGVMDGKSTVEPLTCRGDSSSSGGRSFDQANSCELNPHSLHRHEMRCLKKTHSLTSGELEFHTLQLTHEQQQPPSTSTSRRKRSGSTAASTKPLNHQASYRNHTRRQQASNTSATRREQQIKPSESKY